MVVSVGGVPIGNTSATTFGYSNYAFPFSALAGQQEVRVTFDNDFYSPPIDRNLLVDAVSVECLP
jgi:hypothetical protein